jgi:cbb3-type cytochrome oxidase maturation protein
MEILLLLIPLSVVLALLIGAGFWWSVASGQFDDLEGPAHRILADDDSGGAATAPAEAPSSTKTGHGALTSIKLRADDDR